MTEHFPITPPPELVQQWMNEIYDEGNAIDHFVSSDDRALAARAAAWGADQELEACLCEVSFLNSSALADRVRSKRRPKPKSLKQQALQELDKVDMLWDITEFGQETLNSLDTIRRAIESIPNPS
jgi:hypothetical protein